MRSRVRLPALGSTALTAFVVASSPLAHADESPKQPALVQVPSEDGSMPAEDNSHPSIEPIVSRPPWNGQEAIWGGVGLIIAGAATLIVAVPVTCLSTASDASHTSCFATIGGSAGALGLGGILLAVGELQKSSYKTWLRTHPMFGLSVMPSTRGPSLGWGVSF
jgi:hypothetical protein